MFYKYESYMVQKFKELVQRNIHDKKSYIEKGYDSFDETYLNNFKLRI